MKKTLFYIFLLAVTVASCTNFEAEIPKPDVNLGAKSTSTAIKNIVQTANTVTATFETTPGAKYSVQILPFGKDQPIKKEGFTATEVLTVKTYNLSDLPKNYYDLLFIDVDGKEVKYPIILN